MSIYTDDTFESVWTFDGADGEIYKVLHNALTQTYHLYLTRDTEEVAYKNYVVTKNHQKLTGTFTDAYNHYVTVINNALHCDIGPAALVPYGLNNFRPREDVTHYLIYGKIMSQYTWMTWVKDTDAWPKVMANILGSKE